ncbi:cAMP-dependent protein kinase inhibitor alpha [Grus japonensis]|uniref:cAMP-dependent protein kinase inhibitor alpha n=1 Tax=Grus japonensis TaxID=30415 RepID=A0ABC9YHR9_GRUJA
MEANDDSRLPKSGTCRSALKANPVAWISLQGLLFLERANSSSQFSIISKLANDAFNSCIQIIDKNTEKNRP